MFAQRSAAQNPCYVRLEDASGINTDAYQTELEAAACALRAAFPDSFQNQFKVFDFGFYLHQETYSGGYPEAFAQKIQQVGAMSPYYLLFGKQTDATGVYTGFWVDLKLPRTGKFQCIDLLSPNLRQQIVQKHSFIANEIYSTYNLFPDTYYKVEKSVMDSLKSYIRKTIDCCALGQLRGSSCDVCAFTETQFAQMMSEKGMLESNCVVVGPANPSSNNSNFVNKIVVENGEQINVDQELENLIQDFRLRYPDKSVTLHIVNYPDNCVTFESIWEQYQNDPSDAKMIFCLIGKPEQPGKIYWQSDGSVPLHRGINGIGYTIKKREDNSGGYNVHLNVRVNVIDISSKGLDASVLTAQFLTDRIDILNGRFNYLVKEGNKPNVMKEHYGTISVTSNPINSKTQIQPQEHIMAIVDEIRGNSDIGFENAGLAEIGGSVSTCEKTFIERNLHKKKLALHEFCHNLGMIDDYPSATIMGDLAHAQFSTTLGQKGNIYGRFLHDLSKKSGNWRNKDNIPGIALSDLKKFLDENHISYDTKKL